MAVLTQTDRPFIDWGLGIAVAVIAHGAVYWWMNSTDIPATALGVGVNGIEISLSSAGGTAGSLAAAIEPQAVTAEVVKPETPQEVETVEVEEVSARMETIEPVVEDVEAIEAPSVTEVAAVLQPKPVAKPVEPTQARHVQVTAQTTSQQKTQADSERPVKDDVAQVDGSRGQGDAGVASNVGAGTNGQSSGGGIPGEVRDYYASLQALLERQKKYPRRAKRRGIEGVVTLWFQMNRRGEVLDYRIQESSGNRVLDKAIERLIENASPLPPFPDQMTEEEVSLVVPFRFYFK